MSTEKKNSAGEEKAVVETKGTPEEEAAKAKKKKEEEKKKPGKSGDCIEARRSPEVMASGHGKQKKARREQ